MDTLNRQLYETVITPTMHAILATVARQPWASHFYLAGGSALALQLGHRVSVDLDFFSDVEDIGETIRHAMIRALQEYHRVEILENTMGNLLLRVDGTYTGFFSYHYPLLEPVTYLKQARLADMVDIGLMKLDAILGRGARKDFIDVYFIVQHVPLDILLKRGQEKYPFMRDFAMTCIEGLTYFENADRQADIETDPHVTWEVVKQFFRQEARRLGNWWFEGG